MQTTIYLTRHGATAANLENRFAGRSEEPLHQLGRRQLEEVAAKMKQDNLNAIYTGPLPRARQSAEIIGNLIDTPIIAREAFNEILLPHWDNLTKEEITRQFGPEYPTWLASPEKFAVTGCETLFQVQDRAVKGIEKIFAEHQGETVIVVSHLIVIRCLVLYYREMEIKDFRSINISNASLTSLARCNNDPVIITSAL